jgi:transcription elongation factor GreA-like protein/transcription elongation GreA/GreB family factor
MEYFKQFEKLIAQNDLPSNVKLWQEYCLCDEIEADELIAILEVIKESTLASSMGCYVDEILALWSHIKDEKKKDRAICLIFDLQTTNTNELSNLALEYLTDKYSKNTENFEQKMRLIGLRDKRTFSGAISHFNILNHMIMGNFFIHTGGWGVGEVLEISMLREQMVMEFDYVAGFKELSFANAFNVLVPIEKDHFLARRFGDPDTFETFAMKNPVEILKMLLGDLGPKTALEIKDEICELIIPEENWQKWWQQARTKMKKDTYIQVPSSLKGTFHLSHDELTHESKLLKALNKKPDANTLIEMIYSFMRDFNSAFKSQKFKDSIIDSLKDILKEEISDAQELQIFFILQDLGEKKAENLNELISQYTAHEKIFHDIHVVTYKKRFLILLHKNYKEFAVLFGNILLTCEQNPIRDYICTELIASENIEILTKIVDLILTDPIQAGPLFHWYFQKVMQGKNLPRANDKGDFLQAFFTLLYQLEIAQSNRDLVKKMVQFLINKRFVMVREVFKVTSKGMVEEILLLASKCQSLTDHDMKILYSLAQVVHESLGADKVESEEEKEIVWTTQKGYQKLKERIEEIATVEAIETAREIEAARAHGDLRENSEFKAALEKRDRQQSELKMLSNQMNHIRVLTKNDIDTKKIGIGVVIEMKDTEGKKENYTILGPHDADVENNILSFQSQLAKNLMNHGTGEKCDIKGKQYTILSIKSFL